MSKLDPATVFRSVDVETAFPNVRVRIQGLPEDVQWIADALETAIPGAMDWQSFAQTQCDCLIEISGIGQKYKLTSDIELI